MKKETSLLTVLMAAAAIATVVWVGYNLTLVPVGSVNVPIGDVCGTTRCF